MLLIPFLPSLPSFLTSLHPRVKWAHCQLLILIIRKVLCTYFAVVLLVVDVLLLVVSVCVCVWVYANTPPTWRTPPLSFGGYVTCLPDECKTESNKIEVKRSEPKETTHTQAHTQGTHSHTSNTHVTHTHTCEGVVWNATAGKTAENQQQLLHASPSPRPLHPPPIPPHTAPAAAPATVNNEFKLRGNNWWQEDAAAPSCLGLLGLAQLTLRRP